MDVGTPAICLKPLVFVSQAVPVLHTRLSPQRLAFRSPGTAPLGRRTLYPVSVNPSRQDETNL